MRHQENRIFLIGDLHLDHANIIRYCHRPFPSTEEMNKELVKRWNRTIKKSDTVYFLGDIAFARTNHWLKKLNGNIVFIRGNHDRSQRERLFSSTVLKYGGYRFLLIHDPNDVKNWNGWVIHGHKHNNNLKRYPFMNRRNKTINVSCELLDYTPVSIDIIMGFIKNESLKRVTWLKRPSRIRSVFRKIRNYIEALFYLILFVLILWLYRFYHYSDKV